MKILFLGDIFARPGREVVSEKLPSIKVENDIDLVIANIENAAHGKGVTTKIIREMSEAGVDFFTSGNHIWRQKGIDQILDGDSPVIRPANYPPRTPGQRYQIISSSKKFKSSPNPRETIKTQSQSNSQLQTPNQKIESRIQSNPQPPTPNSQLSSSPNSQPNFKVLIINLMGRVFIKENLDCPFRAVDEILNTVSTDDYDFSVVDFHAEASSEKEAMKHFLSGRVTALIGTHTHVPTADAQIIDGTAYITDVGMCGPADGVIGLEKESILKQFLSQIPRRHEIASGARQINAVIIDIDELSRKAQNLQQIIIKT